FGKTFSLTGWKIGWAAAPAKLSAAVRAAHQFITFATATPLQPGAAVALATSSAYYEMLNASYRRRRVYPLDEPAPLCLRRAAARWDLLRLRRLHPVRFQRRCDLLPASRREGRRGGDTAIRLLQEQEVWKEVRAVRVLQERGDSRNCGREIEAAMRIALLQ